MLGGRHSKDSRNHYPNMVYGCYDGQVGQIYAAATVTFNRSKKRIIILSIKFLVS